MPRVIDAFPRQIDLILLALGIIGIFQKTDLRRLNPFAVDYFYRM